MQAFKTSFDTANSTQGALIDESAQDQKRSCYNLNMVAMIIVNLHIIHSILSSKKVEPQFNQVAGD